MFVANTFWHYGKFASSCFNNNSLEGGVVGCVGEVVASRSKNHFRFALFCAIDYTVGESLVLIKNVLLNYFLLGKPHFFFKRRC